MSGRARDWGRGEGEAESKVWAWSRRWAGNQGLWRVGWPEVHQLQRKDRGREMCVRARVCVCTPASKERRLQRQRPSPQTQTHLIITMIVEQRGCRRPKPLLPMLDQRPGTTPNSGDLRVHCTLNVCNEALYGVPPVPGGFRYINSSHPKPALRSTLWSSLFPSCWFLASPTAGCAPLL